MKSLLTLGIATSAIIIAAPSVSASDSFAPTSPSGVADMLESSVEGTRGGGRSVGRGFRGSRFGGFRGGRGFKGGGFRRGGFRGNRGGFFRGNRGFGGGFIGFYRRPFYGFNLPSYWLAPSFGIANYGSFGLNQPSYGYSWSRYYDDAVLRNAGGTVVDYRQNIDWSQGGGQFAPNGHYNQVQQHQTQPEFQPTIQADRSVYNSGQRVYAASSVPSGSSTPGGFYNGQWNNIRTDENGVVHGEWRGEVADQNGQRYQAVYQGTFTRDGQFQPTGAPAPVAPAAPAAGFPVAQAPVAPAPAADFQTPAEFESYERCLRNRGIGGGVIGAVIGAVAGNRIGGRGGRLEGSLIGGGVGALAGAGLERALDRCERHLPVPQQGTIAAAPIAPAAPVFQQPAVQAPIAQAPVVQAPVFQQQAIPAPQAPVFRQQAVGFPAPVQQVPVSRTPAGFGSYERCLKGRGIGGGVIGSVIGAIAGNRIAGRGNRLEGSLIGGGLGALAGAGLEKALDKCERFLPRQQQQFVRAPQQRSYYPQQVGYYWVPGGYYYPPAQTTVTVIPGTTTTTTTVTEEYVTSHAAPRKRLVKPAVKRLRKPGY